MKTLLVDGDIIAYTCSAVTDVSVDWDDDGTKSKYGNEEQARAQTIKTLNDLKDLLDADRVIVCLSDPSRRYFRHDIYPDYKKQRTHGTPPCDLSAVKQMLRDGIGGFETKSVATLEADDVMGIMMTHPTMVEGEKVIVTSDKDLNQIPGMHYNTRTGKSADVWPMEADVFFYLQALMGDTTDGYPGCPKIGPVKATKILSEVVGVETWKAIVSTYAAKGFDEQYALTQARVARICQHTDYDFINKKVKLWTP